VQVGKYFDLAGRGTNLSTEVRAGEARSWATFKYIQREVHSNHHGMITLFALRRSGDFFDDMLHPGCQQRHHR
jgi:hypothetical protein